MYYATCDMYYATRDVYYATCDMYYATRDTKEQGSERQYILFDSIDAQLYHLK